MLKLIGAIIALIISFVFVFILPGAGFETLAISLIASILSQLGITTWRNQYDLAKGWMKSKTIVGALLVVVPLIAIALINYFAWGVPAWITWALGGLITVGGGTTLKGIFDVLKS